MTIATSTALLDLEAVVIAGERIGNACAK